jgi:hypothetical protein
MALADVLGAAVVRPVHVAFFDIKDDPIYGWTGPGAFAPTGTGDADLDGNVFLSAEGIVQASDVVEDEGIGGDFTLTFAVDEDINAWILGESELGVDFLGDSGGPVYDQLVLDRRAFVGRRAKVWLFFLAADEASVLPEFDVVFNGFMSSASMSRSSAEPSVVTLTCDQDTQKSKGIPALWVDHQYFNPDDTAASFMNNLARGNVAGASGGTIRPPDYDLWWMRP